VTRGLARVATVAGILSLGAGVGAQDGPQRVRGPRPLPFMMEGPFGPEGGNPIVKGQPYSAQTVTEMTQTLADGNRIVQRSEGAVYRDSEGRTRREQTLTGMGPVPFGPDMRGRQVIAIDDVVAGVHYALDPQTKTARQVPRWDGRRRPFGDRPGPGAPKDRIEANHGVGTAYSADARERGGGAAPVRESLGTKVIEGLDAEGLRTTITIPAGEVGNEMPIDIVNERWVSKELQVPVLMRFVDPRMGERVYRLTSITRGEPSPQLFVVPPDYKTVDAPERPMRQKRLP
jgi:hypothetical protein